MSIELAVPSTAEHLEAIRERIRLRQASAADFIAYNLLRGKPASQGFRPATNPAHLSHGQGPFDGFLRASQSGPWAGGRLPATLAQTLTPAQQSLLRQERVRLLCETFRRARAQGLSQGILRGWLRRAMQATPQGSGSVHEHCRQTERCATSLVSSRSYGSTPQWRAKTAPAWMPAWYFESPHLGLSAEEYRLLKDYLRVHDCGKPFVYVEDQDGRAHFTDHARVSAEIWNAVGGSADEQYLIANDMVLHTLPAADLEVFARGRFSKLQLVAALASLWANERDFGGADSTSFKCKLKHLDRRGRALCKLWASVAVA